MLALHRASKGRTASVYLLYNWTVASGLGICLGDACSTGEHRCREPKPPCSMSSMRLVGEGSTHISRILWDQRPKLGQLNYESE